MAGTTKLIRYVEGGKLYEGTYTEDSRVEITVAATVKTKIENELTDADNESLTKAETATEIYNKLDADGHLSGS